MYHSFIVVGDGVVGSLLLAKDTEPITTDISLLTPYFSPTLTFIPFWKSRGRGGGSEGCVRWVSMEGCT